MFNFLFFNFPLHLLLSVSEKMRDMSVQGHYKAVPTFLHLVSLVGSSLMSSPPSPPPLTRVI